jgi:hypothetical protein
MIRKENPKGDKHSRDDGKRGKRKVRTVSPSIHLIKIISGGQTGVDLAALNAGRDGPTLEGFYPGLEADIWN